MSESIEKSLRQMALQDNLVSERGYNLASLEEFLGKYFGTFCQNPYDEKTNPKGIINFGTAENYLMDREIEEKINEDGVRFSSKEHTHYFNFLGTQPLKDALEKFLKKWFSEGKPVVHSEIFVYNGVTTCLDTFAMACCDPGDVIITPTPVYGRIFDDFNQRSSADVQPLDLTVQIIDGKKVNFALSGEILEKRIKELKDQGKKVKGFILVNPQNPLGVIYSEQTVMELMNVCAKFKIHFLSDEIYALSVFDKDVKFRSILSMNVPDPLRTHFTWGISKDFGLAGMRCGLIISKNEYFQKCFAQLAIFNGTPSFVQDNIARILDDTDWCERYIETNCKRLRTNYELVKSTLEDIGVEVMDSKAGLFSWFDLGSFLKNKSAEEEIKLFQEILEQGVFIVPGTVMRCTTVGWFRIVFAVPQDILSEGVGKGSTQCLLAPSVALVPRGKTVLHFLPKKI